MKDEAVQTLQQSEILCYSRVDKREFFYQKFIDIHGYTYYIVEYRNWTDLAGSMLILCQQPVDMDFRSMDFTNNNEVHAAVLRVQGTLFQAKGWTDKGIIYSGGSVGKIIQSQAEDGYMYVGVSL